MGIFIQITVASHQLSPVVAGRLVQVCPVDIFVSNGQSLEVDSAQEDECTLCGMCLSVAPTGALTIYKPYKDETLTSTGSPFVE